MAKKSEWEKLFGQDGPIFQLLLWQVAGQIIGAVLSPAITELTTLVNEVYQAAPLSPAILANLVVRGFIDEAAGADVARRSGVSAGDFASMVKVTAEAVDTTTLMEAYRRKVIPWDDGDPAGTSVVAGIKQGHLDNKWAPVLKALGNLPLSVADAVDAVVEGQITHEDGATIAYENGISAENFQILLNTRGNPPSPTQMIEMVHRGVIPMTGTGPDVTSFEQGLSESALKDKWIKPFEGIMTALPAARTITAMQRNGTIDAATALAYYKQLGLDELTATQYVQDASHVKTATSKELAKGDVLALYRARAIDKPTATSMLADLGYDGDESTFLLLIEDYHLIATNLQSAITKIKGLYIARKIDKTATVAALGTLSVPAAQTDQLLNDWELERTSSVKLLTPAEIIAAEVAALISPADALSELQALGYTPFDAWVLLALKDPTGAGSPPPRGATPSGNIT